MTEHDDFTEDLSKFDDEYDHIAPAEKKEFDQVPNGRYQAKIDKVHLERAKSTKATMLKWELVIISGQYQNRRLFRNNMLATKENISWLKTDLATAGVVLVKNSDLPKRLNELLDVVLEVSVRNRKEGDKEYQNVYLNKKLDIEMPEKFKQGYKDAGKSAADLAF
ncbi:MAG: DUF669 domain-containing protein [Candidatus Schekmanbacteria bacterium]|nr:DUF669 domain-containing protein [Candidatus Schekmanbacteria bacterium]